MAFSSTISRRTVFGNKRITEGTFTNAVGDTGGPIDTGLTVVEHFSITPLYLTSVASSTQINGLVTGNTLVKTASGAGSSVLIQVISSDGNDGYWRAIGR